MSPWSPSAIELHKRRIENDENELSMFKLAALLEYNDHGQRDIPQVIQLYQRAIDNLCTEDAEHGLLSSDWPGYTSKIECGWGARPSSSSGAL